MINGLRIHLSKWNSDQGILFFKDLRQEDTLLSFLFLIISKGLSGLIKHTEANNMLSGVKIEAN